jgi:hypothetical protein
MSQFCLSGFCNFIILVMIYLDAPCCDPQKSRNGACRFDLFSTALRSPDQRSTIRGAWTAILCPENFILRDFRGVMELKLPKQGLTE